MRVAETALAFIIRCLKL